MAKKSPKANSTPNRPALILQTSYFHDSEQPEALRLGQDQYDQLTRPVDDPLAFRAGIPVLSGVRWDRVDLGRGGDRRGDSGAG